MRGTSRGHYVTTGKMNGRSQGSRSAFRWHASEPSDAISTATVALSRTPSCISSHGTHRSDHQPATGTPGRRRPTGSAAEAARPCFHTRYTEHDSILIDLSRSSCQPLLSGWHRNLEVHVVLDNLYAPKAPRSPQAEPTTPRRAPAIVRPCVAAPLRLRDHPPSGSLTRSFSGPATVTSRATQWRLNTPQGPQGGLPLGVDRTDRPVAGWLVYPTSGRIDCRFRQWIASGPPDHRSGASPHKSKQKYDRGVREHAL